MLTINDTVIKLTRGDSAILYLDIYTPQGEVYQLQEGDSVVFNLRKIKDNKLQNPPLIQKTFDSNYQVTLLPSDTKYLKYDQYYYDCVLIFAGGDINTICSGQFYVGFGGFMSENEQIGNDILNSLSSNTNIIIPIRQKLGLSGVLNYGFKNNN